MKLATFAVTAVALAAASAANAQDAQASSTNVTLYGVADAYVQFANGAANLSRVQSVSYTHLTLPTIYSV